MSHAGGGRTVASEQQTSMNKSKPYATAEMPHSLPGEWEGVRPIASERSSWEGMKALSGFYPAQKHESRGFEKSQSSGVVCAVLMPHAPLLVSEVGGRRGSGAVGSCRAMRAAALCVASHSPDSLVVISPHSPAYPGAFGLWAEDPLEGTFAQFNAPHAGVRMPLDHPLERAIKSEARARDLRTWPICGYPLDHGALVPLWFLDEAGWDGPAVVIGLSDIDREGLEAL